jgi:hypothetical protein
VCVCVRDATCTETRKRVVESLAPGSLQSATALTPQHTANTQRDENRRNNHAPRDCGPHLGSCNTRAKARSASSREATRGAANASASPENASTFSPASATGCSSDVSSSLTNRLWGACCRTGAAARALFSIATPHTHMSISTPGKSEA